MNFYKHYIGDYQRDTMRLSMTEDGAYRRLLDEYYATEEPLPLDRDECYRAARATTPDEQAAVDKVLERYFDCRDDGRVPVIAENWNKRMERQTVPAAMRRAVFERDGDCCKYCGDIIGPFHLDHVWPVCEGGKTAVDNLVVACEPCNWSKGGKFLEDWIQ